MSTLELPKVDAAVAMPRYLQAKAILAEAIRSGTFPKGSKLPSTSAIGAEVNVSLITAHKAIQCLVEDGWLLRERGRGTFVRRDFEASVAAKPRFRVALVLEAAMAVGDYYHGALLGGIRRAAERIEPVGEQVFQRSNVADELETIDADALICFHPRHEQFDQIARVARRRPVVVLGASQEGLPVHCVDSQNVAGARSAVRHLIQLGHERIAIVNGPLGATNCRHRFEGYVAELRAHGLEVCDAHVFNAEQAQSADAVIEPLASVLRDEKRPTAIFACGYDLALDVMTLLREMGLQIPRDVSLVGVDDPRSAGLLNPALTTLRQPLGEMGVRAYQRVVQMLGGEATSPSNDLLPTSLVLRDSTGPVVGGDGERRA